MENFEAIVEKHGGFVYNVAYRILGNSHDAEEAAQEAFIAANASLMRFRKEKKARLLNQSGYDDIRIVDWTANPERASLDSELRGRL